MDAGQEAGFAGTLVPGNDAARAGRPLCNDSSVIEKVLEYHLLAALTAELFRRGADFEILRSDIDRHGHDLVIEADGIIRHIQLKGMVRGGRKYDVPVNTRLAAKPSGCVVWMDYAPESFVLGPFRWLGGSPGAPLPPLGDRLARHSRGNRDGDKGVRAAHREVKRTRFEPLADIAALVDRLFGAVGETAQ